MRPLVAMAISCRRKGADRGQQRVWQRKGRAGSTNLDLRSSDPSNGRQIVLHQKVVRLVVETPLADDEVGSGVLDPGGDGKRSKVNRAERSGGETKEARRTS